MAPKILRASEKRRLDALCRGARVFYVVQIGYDDAQLVEPMQNKSHLVLNDPFGFTRQLPPQHEVDALGNYAHAPTTQK